MEKIKSLLRQGETGEALDRLVQAFRDTDHENGFIQLSARNFTNQRDMSRGLLDYKEFQVIQNRIVHDTLTLVDQASQAGSEMTAKTRKEIPVRKVAFCEANPLDRNLLSNVEARELMALFQRQADQLKLNLHLALSLQGFTDAVEAGKPDVIHFSAFANVSGIYFHDKHDQPVQIDNQVLALHLDSLDFRPECIFFNTFISRDLARELSGQGIFVIGFQDIIDSQAAIAFATGFYTALGYGKDYPEAYLMGARVLSGGQFLKAAEKLYAFQDEERFL